MRGHDERPIEPVHTPTSAQIREFVMAGHGDLAKVKAMLAGTPSLLHAPYQWAEHDYETAIQAAAHVGSVAVAEYLLAHGAALEICTAAMLGRADTVEHLLDTDPGLIQATGAHGIPLLTHAALSGNVDLVQRLFDRGARKGTSGALANAVTKGHLDVVRWILEHGTPDLTWKNFQGKTVLEIARERGDEQIVQLLRAHGAG